MCGQCIQFVLRFLLSLHLFIYLVCLFVGTRLFLIYSCFTFILSGGHEKSFSFQNPFEVNRFFFYSWYKNASGRNSKHQTWNVHLMHPPHSTNAILKFYTNYFFLKSSHFIFNQTPFWACLKSACKPNFQISSTPLNLEQYSMKYAICLLTTVDLQAPFAQSRNGVYFQWCPQYFFSAVQIWWNNINNKK